MALTKITNALVSVNAIQGTLIADNAITAVHIATNAVSSTLIADNAITAVHIAQNVITVTQLADDAVEADKIADGVITTNHLNSAMISSQSAVTANSSDYVLIGDASDSNALKKALVSDFGNTSEQIQDIAGAMFTSNTETGITATYEDGDGTIDLVVGTLNQDTTGSAATLTTARTIGGVSFDGTANIDLLATDIKIGEDDQTKIDFETADEIHFYAANAEQVYVADGVFGPQTDNDVDLGTSGAEFKNLYIDGTAYLDNIDLKYMESQDDIYMSSGDGNNNIYFRNGGDIIMTVHGNSDSVGIGTGTAVPGGMLETYNATDNTKHWRIHRPGSAEFGIGVVGTSLAISPSSSMAPASNTGLFLKFNTGKVGIGTSEPKSGNPTGTGLHISAGSSSADPNDLSCFNLEDDTHLSMCFLQPVNVQGQIRWCDPNDDGQAFILYDHNNNQMSFGTGQAVRMTMNSSNISGDFNDTSDVALKENITDITGGLSIIKQLQPRNFDWKDSSKNNGVAGFVAQEVETILPKEVHGEDYAATTKAADGAIEGGTGKTLNVTGIVAHAVKAIQELEARIEALE